MGQPLLVSPWGPCGYDRTQGTSASPWGAPGPSLHRAGLGAALVPAPNPVAVTGCSLSPARRPSGDTLSVLGVGCPQPPGCRAWLCPIQGPTGAMGRLGQGMVGDRRLLAELHLGTGWVCSKGTGVPAECGGA